MAERLTTCANGDGNPICPPSQVICRECINRIGDTLREMLAEAERREKEARDA